METGSSSFPTKDVAGPLYQAKQTQKLVDIHQNSANKFEDDPKKDPDTVVISADNKAQTQEDRLSHQERKWLMPLTTTGQNPISTAKVLPLTRGQVQWQCT